MEHKHDNSPGPDLRVIQNSPEVGEHSSSSGTDEHQSITTPLQVPAINMLVGSPPKVSETAATVEGNKVVEDVNNPSASGENELAGDMISLTEAFTTTNEQQRPTVKSQRYEHKSQSARLGNSSRRARSAERPSVSDNSLPTRPSGKPTSDHLSRKSIDSSAGLLTTAKKPTARDKSPERRSMTANKPSLSNNNTSTSDSDDDQTTSSVMAHKRLDMESRSVASSKSSTSLSSQPAADNRQAVANNQPAACTVGEKVMVETPNGFKFGDVKFVGPTEFAPGEWIGVALERPKGE